MNKIVEKVNSIKNVNAICIDSKVIVSNKNKYQASFQVNDVKHYYYINSPENEQCLKIDFDKTDFIIVTPNDFAFNTVQASLIKVENLPPVISIIEILRHVSEYLSNPEPTDNIDETLALYIFTKQLVISALNKNFEMNDLLQKVKAEAAETSIDDIDIYE